LARDERKTVAKLARDRRACAAKSAQTRRNFRAIVPQVLRAFSAAEKRTIRKFGARSARFWRATSAKRSQNLRATAARALQNRRKGRSFLKKVSTIETWGGVSFEARFRFTYGFVRFLRGNAENKPRLRARFAVVLRAPRSDIEPKI